MFRRYIRIYIYFLSSTSTFNIFRSLPNRPLQSLPHSFHKHYHHRNVIHTLRGIFSVFINTLLRAYFLCPPYTAQCFPRLVKNLRLSLWPFCSISWDYSMGERMKGSATPATVFVRHINLNPPPLYIPCLCNVFCTLHAECTDVGYVGDVKHSISRAYPYMCCEHELCCDYFWSRWRASGCCHQLVFGSSHTLLLAVTTLAQKDSTKRWRNI